MVDNIDYDAYLAIVPGEFLHKIYYDHGPHLLEGNVRAFLSNRGKINRGIRNTIRTEPTKFFTYNNGIACTAAKITLSPDGHKIVEIEDLQIINGGQTTASLTSAVLKDKLSLDNIFVPMKMTVVKNDDYDTMIQNISKYANSQNTVTDADFFSNHPFHRTLATLSTHTPAPAKDGSLHGTYWYYERSRGKYEQEQFKLYKKSDIENFKKKYPKCQVHIRKNNEKYRTLIRSELDYFSIMDTIITIGENFASKLESVNNNSIPERYKLTSTYDEYIAAQPVRGRNLLSAFPYKIEVEDKDGNAANIDFAISGWMGTVRNLPDLRLLEKETDDAEDEDRITINDNRISLYSRGKLGEYDILSKIKNNRNSEAYVIGELYVDIFEQDGLADMAISNRRGYEENDPRYIEVIKIAKRLLGYIVGQKDIVSKRRKEDDQRIEDEKIKKKFWENPQTREILELRLNDAEKQVVQEENLQFTRAVNNGKQTKKIFISHKEEHKLYGQFIVDVLETYGVDVVSTIIFTGDRRLGVPQGKDIYDYLKDCFREDLMVIFLFSKAFYDSNICISEAGAAWATNQNCMNVVIDISFSDIEKPSNNALSSIKFQQIRTPDQTITVTEFFKTIIEEGLHFEYDESKLQKALNYVLKTDKYSDQKIDFPATFLPKRKFLPVPRCPKCHNIMLLTEENGRLKYVCSNVSCDECYEAVIN